MIKILFVCTGNICRSPMAEAVMQHRVAEAGLGDKIQVASAGTSDEEYGNPVHPGTRQVLGKHGIAYNEQHSARQITRADFRDYDYLLAMDSGHLNRLKRLAGDSAAVIAPFLSYARQAGTVNTEEVPDPWYTGRFDETYDLISKGCAAFLNFLRKQHNL
jgi:protein-tyrosine phosphatase